MTHVHPRISAAASRAEPYALPVSGSLAAAYRLSAITASLLFVAAVAGLQYGERGLYQTEALLLPQIYGQDAFALIAALPVLLIGMWMTRRGSARGLMLWAGALLFVAYWYHFLLGGIPYGAMFLVHVGLVSTALIALFVLLARVDVERFWRRFPERMPGRALGGLMVALPASFAALWIADAILRVVNGESLEPAVRSVYAIDLTVMLPMSIAAGVLLWKDRPWGYVLAGPLLINATFSLLTLLTTAIVLGVFGGGITLLPLVLLPCASVVMLLAVLAYFRGLRV